MHYAGGTRRTSARVGFLLQRGASLPGSIFASAMSPPPSPPVVSEKVGPLLDDDGEEIEDEEEGEWWSND